MKEITVAQIIDEAIKHEELARTLRQVAKSLSGLNPNIALVIHDQDESIQKTNGTSGSAATDQVVTKVELMELVMRENGKPMSKQELLKAMEQRGQPLKIETLTSYLSRDKERFKRHKRGIWKLRNKQSEPPATNDPQPEQK
jgi:hypothetical protein